MLSNYPPGVNGSEYEISGPEWEEETDEKECPNGHSPITLMYHRSRGMWGFCSNEKCRYYDDPIEFDEDDYREVTEEPDWESRTKDALVDED